MPACYQRACRQAGARACSGEASAAAPNTRAPIPAARLAGRESMHGTKRVRLRSTGSHAQQLGSSRRGIGGRRGPCMKSLWVKLPCTSATTSTRFCCKRMCSSIATWARRACLSVRTARPPLPCEPRPRAPLSPRLCAQVCTPRRLLRAGGLQAYSWAEVQEVRQGCRHKCAITAGRRTTATQTMAGVNSTATAASAMGLSILVLPQPSNLRNCSTLNGSSCECPLVSTMQ